MEENTQKTPTEKKEPDKAQELNPEDIFLFEAGVNAKEIKLDPAQPGQPVTGTISGISFKDVLLFHLYSFYTSPKIEPKVRAEVKRSHDFIKRVFIDLNIKLKENIKEIDISFKCKANTTEEEMEKHINTPYVMFTVAIIYGRREEFLKVVGGEDLAIPMEVFRKPGHYVDQVLKYNYPKEGEQLDIWSTIDLDIKEKIEDQSVLVEGIKLSPGEYKLIDSINLLLHNKSQTTNPDEENFYSGNEPIVKDHYGKDISIAPIIRVKPSELYNQYKAGKKVSGEDIKEIKRLIQDLQDKKFYIRYERRIKAQGKTKEDKIQRIETYAPLLHKAQFYEMTPEERNRIDSGDSDLKDHKEELILQLNPIFKDQINTKYIKYPADINRRMLIAHGGSHNWQKSTLLLRDYLFRELSSKRYSPEINYDKLLYQLGLETYVKQSRKKLIKKNLNKAIEVNKNLGLLLIVKEATGSQGQLKYIFHLNRDFIQ